MFIWFDVKFQIKSKNFFQNMSLIVMFFWEFLSWLLFQEGYLVPCQRSMIEQDLLVVNYRYKKLYPEVVAGRCSPK